MRNGVNEMASITHQKREKTERILELARRRFDRLNDYQRKGYVEGLVISLAARMSNAQLQGWMSNMERAEEEASE